MNPEQESAACDRVVRSHVYGWVMRDGLPPTISETSSTLSRPPNEVRASFQRLADGHILVLQQGSGEILMANPFSAVPTLFVVETTAYTAFGNCIWDALGIPAMLHQPGRIRTACGCCGEAMECEVTGGRLAAATGVVHFAIPALRWWEDIVFT